MYTYYGACESRLEVAVQEHCHISGAHAHTGITRKHHQSDSWGSAGDGEGGASERLRLANALQQLGCQHVMQTYWGNSPASQRSSEPL